MLLGLSWGACFSVLLPLPPGYSLGEDISKEDTTCELQRQPEMKINENAD